MKQSALSVVLCAFLFAVALCAASADPIVPAQTAAQLLTHLSPEHPRVMLTPAKVESLKEEITTDPHMKAWYAQIHAQGQKLLGEPATYFDINDNTNNLVTIRVIEEDMRILGLLWQIERNPAYPARAWQDLDYDAKLPDWNLHDTLNMGEMAETFAVGYDWMYDAWTPAQRDELRAAMIGHALNPAIASHWWAKMTFNWNDVINGGVGSAALAIADTDPVVASQALQITVSSLPYSLDDYAPDGAWPEGIIYWSYASTFATYLMSALQTATGTDDGLSQSPGFPVTGLFPIQMTSPNGMTFDFGDADEYIDGAPCLFWMAKQFSMPLIAKFQLADADKKPEVMDLVWFSPKTITEPAPEPPLATSYQKVGVVCMRSAWNDPNATYVGFKAGNNAANHGHLDEGTFVYDTGGNRFARQLWHEAYSKPGYFDFKAQRWTYYRARAEGANTLVINPSPAPDQDPTAQTKMIKESLSGASPFAIADLTPAYAKDASHVERGLMLIGGHQLLIQDEIATPKTAEVWWFMHTKANAKISADERSVLLNFKPGQQSVSAQILSPAGARFQVMPDAPMAGTDPPSDQTHTSAQNRKLAIELTGVQSATIAVTLTPVVTGKGTMTEPTVKALSTW